MMSSEEKNVTGMDAAERSPSKFAAVLRVLLDDTDIFTRDEWADALGVTTPALSQWVNDHTLPRASTLRSLLDIVRRYKGPSHPTLRAFDELSEHPAEDISPHGDRMRPTLGHYVVRPVLEGFQRVLKFTLQPAQQEQVLARAAAESRRLRDSRLTEQASNPKIGRP